MLFSKWLYRILVKTAYDIKQSSVLLKSVPFEPSLEGVCVVFLGKALPFGAVHLSTQAYKQLPVNCCGNLATSW